MALDALLFHRHALVVVMDSTCVAGATLAAEVGPAVAAEQLGRQQIIVLGLVAGRGFLVLRQLRLSLVKEVLGDWQEYRPAPQCPGRCIPPYSGGCSKGAEYCCRSFSDPVCSSHPAH